MRIAIFTDTYFPEINGVVTSIMNSTEILAKKGHIIKIFAPKYKKRAKLTVHRNISIERAYSVPLISNKEVRIAIPNIVKISKSIKRFKPDIIHVHTHPGTMSIIGTLCAKMYKIPLIGTFHTLVTEQLDYISFLKLTKLDKLREMIKDSSFFSHLNSSAFAKRLKRIKEGKKTKRISDYISLRKIKNQELKKQTVWSIVVKLYSKCNIITTPSLSIKKELKKHGLNKKIIVLSNGLMLDKFLKKKDYRLKNKILHIGRISYEKNIDVIIKAVGALTEKYPHLKLTIIGGGPALESLKKLSKEMHLERNIVFTGFVKYSELPKLITEHDFFATASTMETQGLVILESMTSGLPIVGVNKYAIPDVVKHGKNGFIAEPFNAKQISMYMEELLQSQKLREKFGKTSIKLAYEHELGNVVNKLERIYLMCAR